MSETSTPVAERRPKSKTRIWFFLSVVVSLGIFAWGFSLPFRSGGSLRLDSGKRTAGAASMVGEDISDLSSDAAEFRAAAIALDREFMRARREKTRLQEVPGKVEVKRAWNRRLERARRQVKEIGEAKEGTLQWQERQELIKSLEDGPL